MLEPRNQTNLTDEPEFMQSPSSLMFAVDRRKRAVSHILLEGVTLEYEAQPEEPWVSEVQ